MFQVEIRYLSKGYLAVPTIEGGVSFFFDRNLKPAMNSNSAVIPAGGDLRCRVSMYSFLLPALWYYSPWRGTSETHVGNHTKDQEPSSSCYSIWSCLILVWQIHDSLDGNWETQYFDLATHLSKLCWKIWTMLGWPTGKCDWLQTCHQHCDGCSP